MADWFCHKKRHNMKLSRRFIMKEIKKIVIPNLVFHSEYFKCPRCGWEKPNPILVKGDVAPNTRCENCGNSYLIRIK